LTLVNHGHVGYQQIAVGVAPDAGAQRRGVQERRARRVVVVCMAWAAAARRVRRRPRWPATGASA
jgi:hypothetical protein